LRALNEALSAVPGLEYVLKHRLKTSAGALLELHSCCESGD